MAAVLLGERADAVRGAGGGGNGGVGDGELRAGAGGIADSDVQGGIYGASGAAGAADYWGIVQSDGAGVVGDRGGVDDHGDSSDCVHVAGNAGRAGAAGDTA